MKLNLTVDLKKLIHDMRGPKGAAALTEEFERMSGELKKLKADLKPQAQAQLKRAEARYQELLKKWHAAQKDLDKEVTQRINIVKKQAKAAEKNLNQYKKLAMTQKSKIEAAFSAQKKTAKKKTSKKRTGAAKTSKKATSKKTSSKKA
ncbi:MAG: hypothetical protein COT73_09405 [Bdellovibrio sp. CG10_big_fil_rev_8_21_14_0_10_47_8]|nr:MAG: hypothetical protein COT73_09405 [Bdellovibrio sp. CG10_big_fil_rev_8_21_14_0_10_47_8]